MTQDPPENDRHAPATAWSTDSFSAADVVDDAVLMIDANGGLLHANPSARALAARLDPVQSDPAALLALIPANVWDAVVRDGRWIGDVSLDAAGIVLEIKAYRAQHDGNELRFVMINDVTARVVRERELRQRHDELQRTLQRLAGAQEQLLQSEKMASIGSLAAGVAHEINNPIGYVQSNLGTLQDYAAALFTLLEVYADALEGDEVATGREAVRATRERLDVDFIAGDLPQLLTESREGIDRVCKIVQDLKDFSRSGRDDPMREADLLRGLDSTLNIVWNDLKYKAKVEKHYAPLPPVECHASEINQVFMNLLINAGQAIGERGEIVLASGVDGDEVWISVSDDGCGIPDEALARIFDPFYTTKPIGRGTGLGLSIAYGIVAKHHGRIEVSSRVGEGTTFKVVLPVRQPREGVVAEP
jgi:two-component system NtrC family sensor kinase